MNSAKKAISCSVCQKSFNSRSHYKRHYSTVHKKERKYGCKICGKKFGQKTLLQRHSSHCGKAPPPLMKVIDMLAAAMADELKFQQSINEVRQKYLELEEARRKAKLLDFSEIPDSELMKMYREAMMKYR